MGKKNARKKRECRRKTSHETQAKAVSHIINLTKQGKLRPGTRSYKCKYCHKWHIGRAKTAYIGER